MAYVLVPGCPPGAAATASLVDSGLEAHRAMSAPPAFSVSIRFAVSLVTWRHAARRWPLRGCSLVNRSRMSVRTGISRAAQSTRSWPCVARPWSLTSLPRELTFKTYLLVGDLTHQSDITKPLASVEVCELDQDLDADDRCSKPAHEPDRGRGRPAGGQNIIHDQDLLTGLHGVGVNLERVGAVLEVVRLHYRRPRELAGLANGHEPGAQLHRHRGAGDEATGLDRRDKV